MSRSRTRTIYRNCVTTSEAFNCQRCGKATPRSQAVYRTIFGRDAENGETVLTENSMEFCSTTCASHEQFSREG